MVSTSLMETASDTEANSQKLRLQTEIGNASIL
jgi:hypothetical protein